MFIVTKSKPKDVYLEAFGSTMRFLCVTKSENGYIRGRKGRRRRLQRLPRCPGVPPVDLEQAGTLTETED